MELSDIDIARNIEETLSKEEQVNIETIQTIHDGVYTRTIMIPKDTMIVGALIKIPTTIIYSGMLDIYINDDIVKYNGYGIIQANENRKQVIYAREDSYMTMIFKTDAFSFEEAEEQFTDEFNKLKTRS
jgi:hypothetical protein